MEPVARRNTLRYCALHVTKNDRPGFPDRSLTHRVAGAGSHARRRGLPSAPPWRMKRFGAPQQQLEPTGLGERPAPQSIACAQRASGRRTASRHVTAPSQVKNCLRPSLALAKRRDRPPRGDVNAHAWHRSGAADDSRLRTGMCRGAVHILGANGPIRFACAAGRSERVGIGMPCLVSRRTASGSNSDWATPHTGLVMSTTLIENRAAPHWLHPPSTRFA